MLLQYFINDNMKQGFCATPDAAAAVSCFRACLAFAQINSVTVTVRP
jgi:hypothetical protein